MTLYLIVMMTRMQKFDQTFYLNDNKQLVSLKLRENGLIDLTI